MKLISFIVGRHSFGTHLARVPNGRDGRTFVVRRRAEGSSMTATRLIQVGCRRAEETKLIRDAELDIAG